jgi:hypothetical protein
MKRSKKESRAERRKARRALSGPFARDAIPSLAPEELTLVPDFTLALRDTGTLGMHLVMISARLGRLAGFAWWDHVDRALARMTEADIPGVARPSWSDLDQGWQLIVERRGDEVLVFEGGDDWSVLELGFRVPLPRWLDAWREIIASCGGQPARGR